CQHFGNSVIYMLFYDRGEKKVYIGQSENLKNRLLTHIRTPDAKVKNWDRAVLINDGRNASQSDFNDENIRLTLENFLIQLFKINRYKVITSASRNPSLSSSQKILINSFKQEIVILLTRKTRITKVLTEKGDDEVYNDEVRKLLLRKGYKIAKWGRIEAAINGEPAYIRAGSLKSSGWQVTFRGSKPSSFKTNLQQGKGFLLMPRGPVLLIPLKEIRNHIHSVDSDAFIRDTIDVFVKFEEQEIFLIYKGKKIEISRFALQEF
ncbi:MAG: GIY-YIG nuclease family protein, partial [Calditrichaeota bacterium]|nr:GIY-YIG nuclease family protein [Calditrichota bacterium]